MLSSFPKAVKDTFGFNLDRLSRGESLYCKFRPMPSVGKGVFELKEQDERTWYRLMYLTMVDGIIYVLHCFEKDSNKTSQRDLAIAEQRLKQVRTEIAKKRAEEKGK